LNHLEHKLFKPTIRKMIFGRPPRTFLLLQLYNKEFQDAKENCFNINRIWYSAIY